MKYYDLYFEGDRAVFDKMMPLAFRYDHGEEEGDKRPPSVLYIPYSNFESRDSGGETSGAIFSAIDSIASQNPKKTSIKKRGLSLLRFTDYTASGLEEPIRKLLDEARTRLWDKRERMMDAEYRDGMSEEEIEQLLDKYPQYTSRLTPEYDEFFDKVMCRWTFRRYDRAMTFDQMLEVVCRHVDGDQQQLLPDGRNAFVIRKTRRLRNHLLYTRQHFARFVVTFNSTTGHWWIEEESIADINQDRFKGKVTRLFWQKIVP